MLDYQTAVGGFFRELGLKNYALKTMEGYREQLGFFHRFCEKRGKSDLRQITPADVKDYQQEVAVQKWCRATKNKVLARLKIFFGYLGRRQLILVDPTEELAVPSRREQSRPLLPLTKKEIDRLISCTDTPWHRWKERWMGVRDRAILELFYSSGLRKTELLRLKEEDIDLNSRVVFVREGKGKKDRVIPLGSRAVGAIEVYLRELRPRLEKPKQSQSQSYLFISRRGNPLAERSLGFMIHSHARRAGIPRRVYPHLLRHTCATHLLEQGAPIHLIQALLGHTRLTTTQIYTHLTVMDLKKVWEKYHPLPRMFPTPPSWDQEGVGGNYDNQNGTQKPH